MVLSLCIWTVRNLILSSFRVGGWTTFGNLFQIKIVVNLSVLNCLESLELVLCTIHLCTLIILGQIIRFFFVEASNISLVFDCSKSFINTVQITKSLYSSLLRKRFSKNRHCTLQSKSALVTNCKFKFLGLFVI